MGMKELFYYSHFLRHRNQANNCLIPTYSGTEVILSYMEQGTENIKRPKDCTFSAN